MPEISTNGTIARNADLVNARETLGNIMHPNSSTLLQK